MARQEADREDLFAEATALVRRVELSVATNTELIIAGFKKERSLSVYFGGNVAYHFDSQGRLKRAFRDGKLYRTQGETLAELMRVRTATETILHRRDLCPPERDTFINAMRGDLSRLAWAIENGKFVVFRQIPADDFGMIEELVSAVRCAAKASPPLAPRYPGKR
jgi:hypothetical protein